MAQTANEELRDAATRSAVFVHRFAESEARKIVKLLNSADADLVEILHQRLEGIKSRGFDTGPATTTRLTRLLDQLRQVNTDIYQRARMTLTDDLLALAGTATESTIESLNMAVGVDLDLLSPAPSVLRSAVTSDPFRGKVMSEWFSDLSRNRINAMRQAINIGIVQGQTNDQIVRRIVGTRVQGFRDGILNIHRNHAATVVRTAANHTNSRARELVYDANSDVVKEVQMSAQLDGRTTAFCRAIDGRVFPINEGPRPPFHANCRTTPVPVTKSWAQLSRNGALKAGRGSTKIDTLFEQRLAAKGFTPAQIAATQRATRASMTGQVPDALTYGDWLAKQPRGFVEDVLGVDKAKLFLDGGLSVDRFVDIKSGREFTLQELRIRETAAWRAVFGG